MDEDIRYNVFIRDWWKENPNWPDGKEPCPGPREYLAEGLTWAEAREMCEEYNNTHDPGPWSRKAEFEEA